jgi:hypothetical protein
MTAKAFNREERKGIAKDAKKTLVLLCDLRAVFANFAVQGFVRRLSGQS